MDEAAALLRAVTTVPRDLDSQLLAAEVFSRKEPLTASTLLDRVLQKDPDHAKALFLKARTLLEMGEAESAASFYLRAAEARKKPVAPITPAPPEQTVTPAPDRLSPTPEPVLQKKAEVAPEHETSPASSELPSGVIDHFEEIEDGEGTSTAEPVPTNRLPRILAGVAFATLIVTVTIVSILESRPELTTTTAVDPRDEIIEAENEIVDASASLAPVSVPTPIAEELPNVPSTDSFYLKPEKPTEKNFEALPVISPGTVRQSRDEVSEFWHDGRSFPEGIDRTTVIERQLFDLIIGGPEFQGKLYLKAGSRYVGEPIFLGITARDRKGPLSVERVRGQTIAIRDTVIHPMELSNGALFELTLRVSDDSVTLSYYLDESHADTELTQHAVYWRLPPMGKNGPDMPGLWYADDFPEGLNLAQLREISRENHVSYDQQAFGKTSLSKAPLLSGALGYDRETAELPSRLQNLTISGPMWKMRRVRMITTGDARLRAVAGEESAAFDQGWRAVWSLEGNARTNPADLTLEVR